MPNISGVGDRKASSTFDGGETVTMSQRYIQQYLSQSIHMPTIQQYNTVKFHTGTCFVLFTLDLCIVV